MTLLFTDIEGSTRLLQELGRGPYVEALEVHRRLLREAFAHHGGVEVEMQGDSFHFAFASARDAVAAAVRAQHALARHAWVDAPIRVRIGIHTGEPVVSGGLYAGIDVHRAARVMSAGHGGQVLLSETTRALLDDEFELVDLGPHRLKDLAQPVRLCQVGSREFPPLKTLHATNLPMSASPLVGRDRELEELLELLRNGHRVVTVTGAGGSGKTRIALQAAAELADAFRDGASFVPLAGVGTPELVLPSLGQALGAHDDLADYLAEREALLLLDNFEHVLDAAPQLSELLATAPRVKALVTSRSPLHVDGEREYPLDPLREDEAVTLFVERSRASGRPVPADATAAEICRRLDRLPLAIELAAATSKTLAPRALLAKLDTRLPVLTGGRRDAPARQRTLRATIEWSYDLLDDDAKRMLGRLSVFAGTFSLRAAEEVCNADLGSIATLVDCSLLKASGDDRFHMLETIREYARVRLDESGEGAELSQRHGEFFLALAEAAAPHLRVGGDQPLWLARLKPEQDNIRAALAFFGDGRPDLRLRLAAAAWWFWWARGSLLEGRRWLAEALTHTEGDPLVRAAALEGAAYLAYRTGDLTAATELCNERLAIYRERHDETGVGSVLLNLGNIAVAENDPERAARLYRESLRLLGDDPDSKYPLMGLGILAHARGKHEDAQSFYGLGLEVSRRDNDDRGVTSALIGIAMSKIAQSDLAGATAPLRDILEIGGRLGDFEVFARYAFIGIARLAAAARPVDAALLIGQSDAALARHGSFLAGHLRDARDETVALRERDLGKSKVERLCTEGAELTLEETVGLAHRVLDDRG